MNTKDCHSYRIAALLHSPEYRSRFASDLKKMLRHILLTQKAADYKKSTQTGRDLAECYPAKVHLRSH